LYVELKLFVENSRDQREITQQFFCNFRNSEIISL
jgi:hypothetical protein